MYDDAFQILKVVLVDVLGFTKPEIVGFVKVHLAALSVLAGILLSLLMSVLLSKFFGQSSRETITFLARLFVMPIVRVFRGPTILVLCDADEHQHTARRLGRRLCSTLRSRGIRVHPKVISDGNKLISFPLSPSFVGGLLILITDVTPLSVIATRRNTIQKRIIRFTGKGGLTILGHDLLYRRTRNDKLREFAGGSITGFAATNEKVVYVKGGLARRACSNAALEQALPLKLELSDKEILQGQWHDDVEFIYSKEGSPEVPLVTRRVRDDGVVFWINSGDTDNKGPAPSVSVPEQALVDLLTCMIQYR